MKKLLLLITTLLSIHTGIIAQSDEDEAFIEQLEEEYKPLSMMGVKRFFPKKVGEEGDNDFDGDAEYDDIIERLNSKKTFRHANGYDIGELIKETECSKKQKEELWYSFLHAAMQSSVGIGRLFRVNSPEVIYKNAWKLRLHPLVALALVGGGGAIGAGGGYAYTRDLPIAGMTGGVGATTGAMIALRIFIQFKLTNSDARKQLDIIVSNLARTMIEFHKDLPESVYQDLISFLKSADEAQDRKDKHNLAMDFYHHVAALSALEWK